jgi:biopolymer transport protein ExbD
MRFKRPKVSEIDMGSNIVNMVDVLLLLLIFFMISTTFTKKAELNITLPQASGEPVQQSPKQLEIFITATGQYSVDERALVNNELPTLKAALQALSAGDNSLPLTITADANTPHQAVVRAMDAAGQLGFSHLSLTTQQPQPE